MRVQRDRSKSRARETGEHGARRSDGALEWLPLRQCRWRMPAESGFMMRSWVSQSAEQRRT